jgi:gamma-glutamyltranspeptidase/glutathione hydrolase
LGGGGFLLVRAPDARVELLDFFVNTPGLGLPTARLGLHFEPCEVRFTGAVQTFHVGLGSVAVPSVLAGLLEAHRRFGGVELGMLVAPARQAATAGVALNEVQAELLLLVRDLMSLTPSCAQLAQQDGRWLELGEHVRNPDLAGFLAQVADGSIESIRSAGFAGPLLDLMREGGLVTRADLASYRVEPRRAAHVVRGGADLFTNPAPSFGGPIIAETLATLPFWNVADPAAWATLLSVLEEVTVRRREQSAAPLTARGTTHISAVDGRGMVASMTISNGATSGFVIPGTGIMLNNMLGEADLNPDGFHSLPPGRRMGSMMSPSVLVSADGTVTGLGTGGSERIRSAMVQVLLRLIDGGQDLAAAVGAARVHSAERGLQVEPGLPAPVLAELSAHSGAEVNIWSRPNLYFGGVNAVQRRPDGSVVGVADGRRGGAAVVVAPR